MVVAVKPKDPERLKLNGSTTPPSTAKKKDPGGKKPLGEFCGFLPCLVFG